jgi:hypothetical protein
MPTPQLSVVDREVFSRQKALHLLAVEALDQKLVRDLRLHQPFAALREDR